MSWIISYGCTSSAGPTSLDFWRSLERGIDHAHPVSTANWPTHASFEPRACFSTDGSLAVPSQGLLRAWNEALGTLDRSTQAQLLKNPMGIILASTKGCLDDWIWNPTEADLQTDPLTPILEKFLEQSHLKPKKSICVSNACASSLSALFLGNLWLQEGTVNTVLILAVDKVGPFVLQGFQALRALTPEKARPFAKNRTGLVLGEAAAAILLSGDKPSGNKMRKIQIKGVGVYTEGHAATRPIQSGDGLKKACHQINSIKDSTPDLIIAHGTATQLNDPAEDQAFSNLFSHLGSLPLVTATKGCIGHTLGASGAMDTIAACQVIQNQKAFSIANTTEVDPHLKCRYLSLGHKHGMPSEFRRILVTSVGFGGINAGVLLEGGMV